MRRLAMAMVLAVGALASPDTRAAPEPAASARSVGAAFPGARVTWDGTRGLRRLAGLRETVAPGGERAAARSVLGRLAPAAWPGLGLDAGRGLLQRSGNRAHLEVPLVMEGMPVAGASLGLDLRDGLLAAVSASLAPVTGIDRTPWTLADGDARKAACAGLRQGNPGRPCPRQASVRRCWWRSSDGMLRPGALVVLLSPGLAAAAEVLVDGSGEVQQVRDLVRH
jgi:hypothetical protein